jgi:SAM-dependent methyltransferase
MFNLVKTITVIIYNFFICRFLTITAHLLLFNYMSLTPGAFLDIGCGTGAPLKKICDKIKNVCNKIVGVDIHPQYSEEAINLFKNEENVEIYNLDFYKIE